MSAASTTISITGGGSQTVHGDQRGHSETSELEQASLPGECNFGLFRSAGLFCDPVEGSCIWYNILLMLYGESEEK